MAIRSIAPVTMRFCARAWSEADVQYLADIRRELRERPRGRREPVSDDAMQLEAAIRRELREERLAAGHVEQQRAA